MEIKTYRANSIQEALQMIRQDLGSDAVVLRTRQVRAGGLFGLLGSRRCTEVTASVDAALFTPSLGNGRLDHGIDLSTSGQPQILPFQQSPEDSSE